MKIYKMPEYEHIKDNKISKLYREAIVKLVCLYGVEKVSVQKILNETKTSRGNFYAYFKDKFDLMHYVYYYHITENNIDGAVYGGERPAYSENMAYYKKLFMYEGQNSFREFFTQYWLGYYDKSCMIKTGRPMTKEERLSRVYQVGGSYALRREWVLNHDDLSPEVIYSRIVESQSNPDFHLETEMRFVMDYEKTAK